MLGQTYRDELPDKAKLSKFPDVVAHIGLAQTSSIPIERRAEIVGQPFVRVDCLDSSRELFRLAEDRFGGFHPQSIAVRSKEDSSVDAALGTALVSVVTLSRSACIPVPVNLDAEFSLGQLDCLGMRDVCGAGEVVVDLGLGDTLLLHGCRNSISEKH